MFEAPAALLFGVPGDDMDGRAVVLRIASGRLRLASKPSGAQEPSHRRRRDRYLALILAPAFDLGVLEPCAVTNVRTEIPTAALSGKTNSENLLLVGGISTGGAYWFSRLRTRPVSRPSFTGSATRKGSLRSRPRRRRR